MDIDFRHPAAWFVLVAILILGSVALGNPIGELLKAENTAYLRVVPGEESSVDGNVTAFEDLPEEGQPLFEQAVESDSMIELPDDHGVRWMDYRYVRYNSTVYHVLKAES